MNKLTNLVTKSIINYQCNNCSKKRVVIIPSAITIELNPGGLNEYVDVHPCENEELVANILFVDPHLAVRSQVHIRKGDNKQKTPSTASEYSIPQPSMIEMAKTEIQPSEEFIASILRELEIKDKLRQLKYSLKRVRAKKNFDVEVFSKMEFVNIRANLTEKGSKKSAERYLKGLADSLEQLVHLEDYVFNYVVTFLDTKLKEKFDDKNSYELELILQSPVSVPFTDERAIQIFNEKVSSWFPNLNLSDFHDYTKILKLCIENETRTLLDVFKELENQLKLADFISAFNELYQKGLINLDILKFNTFG